MARRRSARLAKGAPKETAQAAPSLESLAERDESPVPEPVPEPTHTRIPHASALSSPLPPPRTPASSSPIKPPMSEMHPSKVHPTMAAPSSALRLGFADIKPSAETSIPRAAAAGAAAAEQPAAGGLATPSKVGLPSSPFTFRFTRQTPVAGPSRTDTGLSERAQRMMEEIRGEAQRIKAELVAKREQDKRDEEANGNSRRIAQAKGKAGRFSAAHMAEFKKMDSIENHPSSFRAQPSSGRTTPLAKGVKRSQSKANLDDAEPGRGSSKATAPSVPSYASSPAKKPSMVFSSDAPSAVKRARQNMGDDASSSRPVSRDASSIPRPTTAGKDACGMPRSHSTLASLMTPTKASLAKASAAKIPASGTMTATVAKPPLASCLKKSATTSNLHLLSKEQEQSAPVRSPGAFDRVKSILRGQRTGGGGAVKAKSAVSTVSTLPVPSSSTSKAAAKTPSLFGLNKPLPSVPATTPSRKLVKRVLFTPEAKKAAVAQNSPSPIKSGIPRSKTFANLGQVSYPNLQAVLDMDTDAGDSCDGSEETVSYPDLTAHAQRRSSDGSSSRSHEHATAPAAMPSPGTFTFRSDHTIRFGSTSPGGFGASRGQASLRRVRPSSVMPSGGPLMPGSFPASIADLAGTGGGGGNKENRDPVLPGVKHGLPNKKRHRPSTDEEEVEREAAERAAKKRRQEPVPEGQALLAPRLVGASASGSSFTPRKLFSSPAKKPSQVLGFGSHTPSRTAMTPSPVKKKATLSLSRLNMLARPKMRK